MSRDMMEPINNAYDENAVRKSIESAIKEFYDSLISKLNTIQIIDIMQSKNPYLYRSKAMQDAAEIVDSVLMAFISSSEETIFGNTFFEPIAIAASGGGKSVSEGIDLEIRDERTNRIFCIAVKSGTSVFNADSKRKQEDNFNKAKKLATQGKMGYEPIIGFAYGKKEHNRASDKSYAELAGEDFWTLITGDPDFYKKIIYFMGNLPERYVDNFKDSYSKAKNRLVRDFSNKFCKDDGSIDWIKLVEFNSASADRLANEEEENCKKSILAKVSGDHTITKKRLKEEIPYKGVDKYIKQLQEEGRLSKEGRTWIVTDNG